MLTNNHVINQAQKISIQLNDGREFDAKLIGSDDQSDIALLQIQNPNKLTQIAIADSDKLRVGDFAVAVGNPFGLGQTATSGIVSALGRSGLNLEGLENFIQTDASINRGNSGGALLNLNGELIGINTAILAPGGGSVGIGFAIPSNMARTLAQQLIDFGEIKRGLLGIKGTEMSADIAKAFNLDVQRGAFVSEVLPGSGSAKAGVKAGDIITSLNGKPLNSFAELRSRIATTEPGTKVKLGLLRNGKPLEVEVTLDTSTSSSASAEMITPALEGATLSDGQLKDGGKGIKIDEVVKGSPAAQAGLQKDDVIIGVNRDRVNSIAEMRKVLAAKPAIIALQIVRGTFTCSCVKSSLTGHQPHVRCPVNSWYAAAVPFFNDASIMFVKLLRSVAIGLIVGAILLVAMPSLRSLNPLSTPQFDSTDETPASYNLAVRRAAPAVVNVYNRGLNTNSHNQLEIRTLGSGVIMDQRGYIITNKHVINDADQIIVALQDGRVFEALLVGSDSLTDLAVLKINATGGLPTIPINARRVPHIGDVVLAIGNPQPRADHYQGDY